MAAASPRSSSPNPGSPATEGARAEGRTARLGGERGEAIAYRRNGGLITVPKADLATAEDLETGARVQWGGIPPC